ncbi:hypothetical protein PWT90_02645 [Aphanocladium album]|nr:hypothetical protein PWT90_02645 [Aphanocladium album]
MSDNPYSFTLSSRFPPANSNRAISPCTASFFDQQQLGELKILPTELLHHILLDCDMRSLAHLQRTNKSMKAVVDSVPARRDVMEHSLDLMRILQATGADRFLACRDIHAALCRHRCEDCDCPGAYLYLLTCRRLCCTCLTEERYRAFRVEQATEQFALHPESVRRLATVLVPRYAREASRLRQRRIVRNVVNTTGWRLVDREAVERRAILAYGSKDALGRVVEARSRALDVGLARKENLYHYARLWRDPGVDSALSASVLLPWYNRGSGIVHAVFGRSEFCSRHTTNIVWYCDAHGFERRLKSMLGATDATHQKQA